VLSSLGDHLVEIVEKPENLVLEYIGEMVACIFVVEDERRETPELFVAVFHSQI